MLFLFFFISDDENSYVHGILTSDNLFDGTISTNTDHYYVEPASKYLKELDSRGIHSVVYKLSDVNLMTTHPNNALDVESNKKNNSDNNNKSKIHHCASERMYRKMLKQQNPLMQALEKDENLHHQKSDLYKYYRNVLLGDKISGSRKIKEFKRRKRWLNDEVSKIQQIDDYCLSTKF